MNKKNEILQYANEVKAHVDAIAQEAVEKIAKQSEPENNGLWKPKLGEKYYCINPNGSVSWCGNDNDAFDTGCVESGNCFKTREEAMEYALRLKYRRMYEAMGRPFKIGSSNYYAVYDHNLKSFSFPAGRYMDGGEVYFDGEAACRTAIKYIGEDNFIRYVLGVREEGTED